MFTYNGASTTEQSIVKSNRLAFIDTACAVLAARRSPKAGLPYEFWRRDDDAGRPDGITTIEVEGIKFTMVLRDEWGGEDGVIAKRLETIKNSYRTKQKKLSNKKQAPSSSSHDASVIRGLSSADTTGTAILDNTGVGVSTTSRTGVVPDDTRKMPPPASQKQPEPIIPRYRHRHIHEEGDHPEQELDATANVFGSARHGHDDYNYDSASRDLSSRELQNQPSNTSNTDILGTGGLVDTTNLHQSALRQGTRQPLLMKHNRRKPRTLQDEESPHAAFNHDPIAGGNDVHRRTTSRGVGRASSSSLIPRSSSQDDGSFRTVFDTSTTGGSDRLLDTTQFHYEVMSRGGPPALSHEEGSVHTAFGSSSSKSATSLRSVLDDLPVVDIAINTKRKNRRSIETFVSALTSVDEAAHHDKESDADDGESYSEKEYNPSVVVHQSEHDKEDLEDSKFDDGRTGMSENVQLAHQRRDDDDSNHNDTPIGQLKRVFLLELGKYEAKKDLVTKNLRVQLRNAKEEFATERLAHQQELTALKEQLAQQERNHEQKMGEKERIHEEQMIELHQKITWYQDQHYVNSRQRVEEKSNRLDDQPLQRQPPTHDIQLTASYLQSKDILTKRCNVLENRLVVEKKSYIDELLARDVRIGELQSKLNYSSGEPKKDFLLIVSGDGIFPLHSWDCRTRESIREMFLNESLIEKVREKNPNCMEITTSLLRSGTDNLLLSNGHVMDKQILYPVDHGRWLNDRGIGSKVTRSVKILLVGLFEFNMAINEDLIKALRDLCKAVPNHSITFVSNSYKTDAIERFQDNLFFGKTISIEKDLNVTEYLMRLAQIDDVRNLPVHHLDDFHVKFSNETIGGRRRAKPCPLSLPGNNPRYYYWEFVWNKFTRENDYAKGPVHSKFGTFGDKSNRDRIDGI